MKNITQIKKSLTEHKQELCTKFQISDIGIFGSYIQDQQNKNSDLDVLVEFRKVPGLLQFIRLENYLTDLLGVKVDLVRRKSLRKELRNSILNQTVYL